MDRFGNAALTLFTVAHNVKLYVWGAADDDFAQKKQQSTARQSMVDESVEAEGLPVLDALALWPSIFARLLIDRQLQILWQNQASKTLFARQKLVTESKGALRFAHQDHAASFRQTLAASEKGPAIAYLKDEATQAEVVVSAAVVRLRPVPLYGILARQPFQLAPATTMLRVVFKLTAAEADMVGRLFNGQSVAEAATALEITEETVRSHIRNLYAKLGVTSRETLFSKVISYVCVH